MSRYSHVDVHYYEKTPKSGLAKFFQFMLFLIVVALVSTFGLWFVGAVLGIAFGALALAIAFAPVLFVVWLLWLVFKAIFV